MRIAIATVQVPFTTGGAEILIDMLKEELIKRGHQADVVSIPFKWYPWQTLVQCMTMGRTLDLTEASGEKIDKVIAMKFPAFYVKHDNKVLWMMHQHRQAYDMWDTPYSDIQTWENGLEIRDFIRRCDKRYIEECRHKFTISGNTTGRLKKFLDIDSEVLYHPPKNYEKLRLDEYGDFIFYPSRINKIKRQRMLVEAARYTKTDVKIVIAGGGGKEEVDYLKEKVSKYRLENKVKLVGFISEEQMRDYYAKCLGVYFGAYDEDYGYITLEAFFSEKPVIVHKDVGGPLEFVRDNENGYVIDTDPKILAEKIDKLYEDRDEARRLGSCGKKTLIDMNMNWDYVINRLLE
ncbi:MAG: glycosyltransferase family 4 protein [Clostridiales bacterium]|nr:glycosyltransferase family 4 protein [Clostridiales bacterium]